MLVGPENSHCRECFIQEKASSDLRRNEGDDDPLKYGYIGLLDQHMRIVSALKFGQALLRVKPSFIAWRSNQLSVTSTSTQASLYILAYCHWSAYNIWLYRQRTDVT